MFLYKAGQTIPASDLVDLGDPADLGGIVLEGSPAISGRFDHQCDGLAGGVFQATRGKIRIHFPFTEHATILAGRVRITDEAGTSFLFQPGDSYLIRQGSDVLWEVSDDYVQKSFFNLVGPVDTPGPMIVYPVTPAPEVAELEALSDVGGTVTSGDPRLSARVDYSADGLTVGVLQATQGEVVVDLPVTAHVTILCGGVRVTDESGAQHAFAPGDGYLVEQGSQIRSTVAAQPAQSSFSVFAGS